MAELNGFEMCTPEQAAGRLRPHVWRRLNAALSALGDGQVRYLQDGKVPA